MDILMNADAALYLFGLYLLLPGNYRRFCHIAVFLLDAVWLDDEQNLPAGCIFDTV